MGARNPKRRCRRLLHLDKNFKLKVNIGVPLPALLGFVFMDDSMPDILNLSGGAQPDG
jgi:hypothetical protein